MRLSTSDGQMSHFVAKVLYNEIMKRLISQISKARDRAKSSNKYTAAKQVNIDKLKTTMILIIGSYYFFLFGPVLAKDEGGENRIPSIKDSIEPIKATGEKYERFKIGFESSWRKFKLDDISEAGAFERGQVFVEPLPVWDVRAVCNGMDLFWFDLAYFKVISKAGEVVDLGAGFTGSAGSEKILFGYYQDKKRLVLLFRGNTLDFLGARNFPNKKVENCPELILRFSGYHFRERKSNDDSGIDVLKYQSKTRKYKATNLRLKETKL